MTVKRNVKPFRKDLTGNRYGKLTVISYDYDNLRWLCKCDCGGERLVKTTLLSVGDTKSCGCIFKRLYPQTLYGKTNTKEHKIWRALKNRCNNKNHEHYHYYGGKGIMICDRWLQSFMNFYDDMGECPENYTIERIDYNGNYCPENCKWISKLEQARNKSNNYLLTYNDQTKCLAEWCQELNLNYKKVHNRIKYRKWTTERAFEK